MPKLKFIDNPSNYEYVTNKLIRCRKATIIEDILKYQTKMPGTYLYIRSIEFVKGAGIINDEYEVHIEVYKAKHPAKSLEAEVDNLRKQLEAAEERLQLYRQSISFTPVEQEPFWFLDASGNPINESFRASCDQGKLDYGNCYRYLEEANTASRQILISRKLKHIARELNQGAAINWLDNKEKKYYIAAEPKLKEDKLELKLNCTTYCKTSGCVYCLDSNFLKVAVERIGEQELMDYIEWNC